MLFHSHLPYHQLIVVIFGTKDIDGPFLELVNLFIILFSGCFELLFI